MRPVRILSYSTVLVLTLCSGSGAQDAATYPNKPVKVIVPAGPGAGLDITARLISEAIEKPLGQRFIIENKPGAGMRIGASLVARAPADGYTLLYATPAPITVTEHFPPKLDYDPGRDFAPVAIAVWQPALLITRPSLPVKSIADLIAHAKANPGAISFGVQGLGSDMHLMLEIFKKRAGIDITPVPYNAAAQAITDLLGGRLDAMFLVVAPVKGHVEGGRLNALATLSSKRIADFPNTPTMAELGLPDMTFSPWFGYLAPAGTPAPIVNKLVDALRGQSANPALIKRIGEIGAELDIVGPAEFGALIASERERFGRFIAEGKFAKPM